MNKIKLGINIGSLNLKNPVMVASGTFGYAEEFRDFIPLGRLGAIVTKTITLRPRSGNLPPRTCETPAGMLNSIGLENPGVDAFVKKKLPVLKKIGVPIIVSIASESDPAEFVTLARNLDKIKEVAAIELNISCPNIKSHVTGGRSQERTLRSTASGLWRESGTQLIAQDPDATYGVVKAVRKATKKTLITKLSPNVTCISECALAAEDAGTDAIALINTLMGMAIDVNTRRPKIASATAGLSGPAVRPVAVKMVWEVFQKTKVPLIGMGGIMDCASALEFIIAGATAVSIGTGNFINPRATIEIIAGIEYYMKKNKITALQDLIGSMSI